MKYLKKYGLFESNTDIDCCHNQLTSLEDSLDYNYFREPNLIVKHRFEEACGEAEITVPEKIIGYEYI